MSSKGIKDGPPYWVHDGNCAKPFVKMVSGYVKAAQLTFNQYFKSTSLNGFQFLFILRGHTIQRYIWCSVLLSNLAFSIYVVLYGWSTFTSNPTITTLESQEYPIWNVPFPAIAICSVNKFSLKAVKQYVVELNSKTGNRSNEQQLMSQLLLLGSMYDIGSADLDNAVNFQEFLDYYDTKGGFYDIKSTMERLAPKCEDIMIRCWWQGEERLCTSLFTLEATSDGYCCTFNYDRFKYKHTTAEFLKTNFTGSARGLIVLLNGTTDDYFYSNRNTVGFAVQLFSPGNFPDSTTGNLREYILNPSREVYLKLTVTTEESTDAIRPYGENQRKCLFKDEMIKEYGDHYSYPECLTKCKLRSIHALCNCVPFYTPSDFKITGGNRVYCTLAHIRCLDRYRVTWITYRPQVSGIEGFEREEEDSLSCPDCLPLCSLTSYNFETTASSIQSTASERTSWGLLENIEDLRDVSLLRIYFASTASVLYKTDVLYTWYEILGNFGGLLGLCLGCSIISLIEIVYFVTIKLGENIIKVNSQVHHVPKKNNRNGVHRRSTDSTQKKHRNLKKNIPQFEYLE